MYRESLLMSSLADLLITHGLRNELRGQAQSPQAPAFPHLCPVAPITQADVDACGERRSPPP
jgi:hypothetical protein